MPSCHSRVATPANYVLVKLLESGGPWVKGEYTEAGPEEDFAHFEKWRGSPME